jgi:multidrug transporter EmrE-like cation transporter
MSTANIFLLSLAEIFGDFKLKAYARNELPKDLFLGITGYGFVIYFLIKCLKTGNILYVNGMWDGMSAIMESIAAYILLGERLKTIRQYIGLIILIFGLYLLKSGGVPY